MNAEVGVSAVDWLHGLQDYFEFTKDTNAKLFVDQLLSVYYSENRANSVKNLCLSDSGDEEEKLSRFNFYFKLLDLDKDKIDFVETVSIMRKRLPDTPILDIFHKYGRNGHNMDALADAFSRGQVKSKVWMVSELAKIQKHFEMVHVHAGWYGQTSMYLETAGIEFDKMRVFDVDEEACKISDTIFNNKHIEGYKVKSTELKLPRRAASEEEKNMPWVTRTGIEYEVKNYSKDTSYNEKTMPDLIINSSAEHMSSVWYNKMINRPMETDPLFVIQTNNLFDVDEHVLCVHSLDHMKKKFPMERIEYEGEVELYGYKRFMLIGRP